MNTTELKKKKDFAGSLAAAAIPSKLTPLAIIASLLLGLFAVYLLPREEEPQIKVPMIDVMVSQPGASPGEVEQRLTIPMEKLLYEIPGVEYIYSTSMQGRSLLVVRFFVGEEMENAIVRLQEKLSSNFDRIPAGVSHPLIKPHSIDDVPIMAITLHSDTSDHFTLRRLAAQLDDEIKNITNVSETKIIGGTKRQITIRFDPLLLAARKISIDQLIPAIKAANRQNYSGTLKSFNNEIQLQTGVFLKNRQDIEKIVVGMHNNGPIYLGDVATVSDGASPPADYVFFIDQQKRTPEAAVTISIAKRPGANAVAVTHQIVERIKQISPLLLPDEVKISITRDYGETAAEKSNELLLHMGIAVFGVALLILFFLGWRESIVILLAIPTTLALTLLIFYLYGYTLNRITLFALIFSIGILVDDAIVVVENIVRHYRLPDAEQKSAAELAIDAVAEVGNPTILATWAVIAAILPMAFVGGLMGPYMRPIPIGSSAAMLFSVVIAFSVTPWAAIRIIQRHHHKGDSTVQAASHDTPDDWFTRLYHKVMEPLLAKSSARLLFFSVIIVLLLAACAMVGGGLVKVKMLPFDNKSEFQVIINMPEGTTLEQTAKATMEMAETIGGDRAVTNCQLYIGTASPYNFNGLVRHYFLRKGATVADIQVNLLPKGERSLQSHEIASRIRPQLTKIAKEYGAEIAVAEVPPGPPVLQTLVAEIYGPDASARQLLAAKVKDIFTQSDGVVDVDWFQESPRSRKVLKINAEKAAENGINVDQIVQAITIAVEGKSFDLLHLPREKEDVTMVLELPDAFRGRTESLLNISLRCPYRSDAPLVPLRELVSVAEMPVEQPLYRKNLKPLIYVTGDVAGSVESPVYAILQINKLFNQLQRKGFGGSPGKVEVYNLHQPETTTEPVIKWDGEWHITLEVFRDLGIAFAVVMVLIYALMVGWFRSYITPLVVMAAIPFSLIGILPAHWALGAFFTATSMIGFMAGAGIVVRNSIILVDFIEQRLQEGHPLDQAVVDAGAIRFRPMLLTALAVVVGASVILADPIFQGLAISLMFGEIASLLISRMAVPVLYFMVRKRHH